VIRSLRHAGIAAVSFLLLGLLAESARADAGPSFGPRGDVAISVSIAGLEPAGEYQAVLLGPDSTQAPDEPRRESDRIPGLEQRLAQEPDGSQWKYLNYFPHPENGKGRTLGFRRVKEKRSSSFPASIRLAVYFPSEKMLILTEPVETSRRDRNSFHARLQSDGTGTLENDAPDTWVEKNYVVEMLLALAATLVIEILIVLIWIGFTKRRASAGRVVLVALAGNLITVPAVWTASLIGKTHFEFGTAVVIYSVAEVGAFVVEGGLYAWLGRFPAWNAFLLSFTANCASFLCGCCLVSFY
jgi:hypothetical protein